MDRRMSGRYFVVRLIVALLLPWLLLSRSFVEAMVNPTETDKHHNLISVECVGTSQSDELSSNHVTPAPLSRVSTKTIYPDNMHVMICEAENSAGEVEAFTQVEILFVRRKFNKKMVVETTKNLLDRIAKNFTLNCTHDTRNRLSRKILQNNLRHKASYSCNAFKFEIYESHFGRRHKRSRSKGDDHTEHAVGKDCTTKNNDTGRYMNVNGNLDCLQCPANTRWNPKEAYCSLCPPHSSRPTPHVFTTCIEKEGIVRPFTTEYTMTSIAITLKSPTTQIPGQVKYTTAPTDIATSFKELESHKGNGPMSEAIAFHTHRALEPPTDVIMSQEDGFINISWSRPDHSRYLHVMVTFFKKVNDLGSMNGNISFSPPKEATIRFRLPDLQSYMISIHYHDDQHHGPKSKWSHVRTVLQLQAPEGNTHCILYGVAAAAILCPIMISLIDWKYIKLHGRWKRCCSKSVNTDRARGLLDDADN